VLICVTKINKYGYKCRNILCWLGVSTHNFEKKTREDNCEAGRVRCMRGKGLITECKHNVVSRDRIREGKEITKKGKKQAIGKHLYSATTDRTTLHRRCASQTRAGVQPRP